MGEYIKICGKINRGMVCLAEATHTGHHTYVSYVAALAGPSLLAVLRKMTDVLRDVLAERGRARGESVEQLRNDLDGSGVLEADALLKRLD